MDFTNCYDDTKRAESYANLEFPGTYYLAFRNLPEIITNHVFGNIAMDFGCGESRSSRFVTVDRVEARKPPLVILPNVFKSY